MSADALRLAAVDLGAESGRVVLGRFDGERMALEVAHRFANRPLSLPDGLHWNLPSLFEQSLHGLGAAAASGGALDSIGVDSWGCDYALLDQGNRMLGLPFHYRDARVSRELIDGTYARVSRAELYARTGIQEMPINTVFQLRADLGGGALAAAERIALIPDLIGLWLTGTHVNELTIASTTGLLEVDGNHWATDLLPRLGLPIAPFTQAATEPGMALGPLLERHRDSVARAAGTIVHAVAGHDTASAFVATPLASEHAAVLSSGTWSLLGVESRRPENGAAAAAYNLTNERGVGGTVRLLRNVMGLWLLQECRRVWGQTGADLDYPELETLAREARADVPLFDPDHESLLHGGDMPARIARLCAVTGQTSPHGPGELCRSILTSLACRYRLVLTRIEQVIGHRIEVVHVVGGGARNELLNRLTANLLGRPLLAGPVEATALGNLLVQAMAIGAISSLEQAREVCRQSVSPRTFEPDDTRWGDETYERFLSTTGLGLAPQAAAV